MEAPILQLVAYTCLTGASVVVATVSALFGYRQNFGWSPIVLVTSHGLGAGGKDTSRFDAPAGLRVLEPAKVSSSRRWNEGDD
jgi:hypothetical protein